MALSRVKTWTAEELTSADLNAEFDNILNNATSLVSPLTANLAAGGFRVTGLGAGSVGSPSLQFTGDTDTGIYSPGANQVGLAAGGVGVFNIFGGASAANTYLYGLYIAPSYTEAATGVHPVESSLMVNAPTITGGTATATLGSTVYIAGPTTGTVTAANYALYVNSGNVRFNDEVYFGANQVSLSDQLDAAKLLITSQAAGDTLYASSTTAWSRLAKGTDGQVLRLASGVPSWMTSGSEWYTPHGLTLSNGTDTTNDIDIAVGDANSNDAAPYDRQVMYLATGLTKKLDATWTVGTNQGMLASGAALADGTYHIFLIMRPDTGVVDIAADSSVTGANVAANTNVAYTKMRRIGSIIRSSDAIVGFIQDGDTFTRKVPAADVSDDNPGTAAVTRTLSVPLGVRLEALLFAGIYGCTTAGVRLFVSDLSITDSVPGAGVSTVFGGAASGYGGTQARVFTNTSGQVRTRANVSDATTYVELGTLGWVDTRKS